LGVLDKLKRNPIEKLSLSELREEQMILRNQLERIRKDINRLDKEKKRKFEEGVGADLIKKKILVQEIKQLDLEQKLNLRNFASVHRRYTFISNLIVLKKYEQQLKRTKLWSKIKGLSAEELERYLVRTALAGKEFDEMLDELNRIFEMEVTEFEKTEDETEKQLLEAWKSVEAGTMDIGEAKKLVSMETEEEKEEETHSENETG